MKGADVQTQSRADAKPDSDEHRFGARMGRCLKLVVMFSALIALASGCELLGLGGGNQNKSNQKKAEQKSKEDAEKAQADQEQAQAEAEAQEQEKEQEYERPEYPGNTRRNPFMPEPEVMQPKRQVAEGDVRPLEPLEQFAVGSLSLVAIISETAVPKAMFVDPEGFGHVVKEGDRIGRNRGQITDIRDNEVEVRETTNEDESETRLMTVELRQEQLEVRDESGLTDEERDALKKLLETEEGQRALEESYQDRAPGANASEEQRRGGAESSDGRFGGIRPPSSQGQ